jgi:hypothetical protein
MTTRERTPLGIAGAGGGGHSGGRGIASPFVGDHARTFQLGVEGVARTVLPPAPALVRPSPYAPGTSDPTRLADMTLQAVDRIGATAADEIERTADELVRGAAEIAGKLRELAQAMRAHSVIAASHVTDFCQTSTSVLQTIDGLQSLIAGKVKPAGAESAPDTGDPVPQFLGPTREGADHAP